MKIVFSDYDGTIKPFHQEPNILEKITFKKNLNSINKFVEKGNKFIITTGRSTNSILKEIKKYNINFSYLTTYDGRVTIDKENNVLEAKKIDKEILKTLKSVIENNKLVESSTFYDEFGVVKSFDNVILVSLSPKYNNDIKELLKQMFKKEKSIDIIDNYNHNEILIAVKSDKVDGAKFLINRNNWNICDIYTVGDSKNDLELLTEYDGYRMLFSHNCLLLPVENVTTSVHKLIKKID